MDKIHLNKLMFYGYHGNLGEEKRLGQKFVVDLELSLDLRAAGKSDRLQDSLCYAGIYNEVRNAVEDKRFNLIEALGEYIISELFETHPQIEAIRLLLKKPQAPVNGIFDYVGVELNRSRNDDCQLPGPGQ